MRRQSSKNLSGIHFFKSFLVLGIAFIVIVISVIAVSKNTELRKYAAGNKKSAKTAKQYRTGEVLVLLKANTDDFKINKLNKTLTTRPKSAISTNDLSGSSDIAKKTISVLQKYQVDSLETIISGNPSKNNPKADSQRLSRWVKLKFSDTKILSKSGAVVKGVTHPSPMSSRDLVIYMMLALAKENTVFEKVTPNYLRTVSETIPNDPKFQNNGQWGLKNYSTPNMDIAATKAWDIATGSASVIVGVVDTGIKLNHEDLTDALWTNTHEIPNNGIDDDNNGFIDDVNGVSFVSGSPTIDDGLGHGTHVSGIIAARTNNEIGVAGVCWNCKIMPVRVFDNNGMADDATVVNGVYYAVNNGASVINASWGGPGGGDILKDSVNYALDNNVVFVAAAGNEYTWVDGIYPASYPGVITVGSINSTGNKSDFSNFGNYLDVVAPGENILSTFNSDSNKYAGLSGTSMATPFVSGIAALMISQGTTNRLDITKRLILATDKLSANTNWDINTGFGKINAYKAISPPPSAPGCAITNIIPQNYITQSNPIQGYAFSVNPFSHYTIEVGQGNNPSSWTTTGITLANSGQNEIIENNLGTVDPQNLPFNMLTLKLTVYDSSGNKTECTTSFTHPQKQTVYVDVHNTGFEDGSETHPYHTIQKAVDLSFPYTTIHIKPGTYNENVYIYKSNLTLEGEPGATIVAACTDEFQCQVDGVRLSPADLDFPLYGNVVKNLTIVANRYNGITVSGYAHNITLENNTIIQSHIKPCNDPYCQDMGIELICFMDNIHVNYNRIRSFTFGIGIIGDGVTNSQLNHNYASNTLYSGIYMSTVFGTNNTITATDNTLINNGVAGLVSILLPNNLFSHNILINNKQAGIVQFWTANTSTYHNTFIANESNPIIIDDSNNLTFTDSIYKTGNFYDIFHSPNQSAGDANGDGIIDSSYIIDASNQDPAPYKYPLSNHEPLSLVSSNPYLTYVNQAVTLRSLTPSVSFGSANTGNKIWLNKGTPHEIAATINSWSIAEINFTVPDVTPPGIQYITVQKSDGTSVSGGYVVVILPDDFAIPIQTITLTTGWNWVTLRNNPYHTELTTVLSDITGKYDKILDEQHLFSSWLPPQFNTLKDLYSGPMYMVHLTQPVTLPVYGSPVSLTQPIFLHAGWNWIGYFGNGSMKIEDALSSIAGNYQRVLSQDAYYTPTNPDISSLHSLEPNQGYMIYVNSPATLIYPANIQTSKSLTANKSDCTKIITGQYTNIYSNLPVGKIDPKKSYTVKLLTPSGITAGCGSVKNNILTISRAFAAESVNDKTYPGFQKGDAILIDIIDNSTKQSLGVFATDMKFTVDDLVHQVKVQNPVRIIPSPTPGPVSSCTGKPNGTVCSSCTPCSGTACKTLLTCIPGKCRNGKCVASVSLQ